MDVQRKSKKHLKKRQFYAPVSSLSFCKALYLLDDVSSFEGTFRRIILPLVQIGKKRDGKREKKSAYRRLNVYQKNLEQFQVNSRLNYWCFVADLTISLLEGKWKTFFEGFQLFLEFNIMLVFGNR